MKPTVYLETSIIGYLTSRPSRDLITAANQQLTHEWWNEHRESFDVFVSQFVIDECGEGDAGAAQQRLDVLTGVRQLDTTEDVEYVAVELVKQVPLPEKAVVDALHIAVATVHGMDYLLTWNCTHCQCCVAAADRGDLPILRIRTADDLHSAGAYGDVTSCGVIQS